MRCDVNVSVHRPGEPFGTRCELKNLNSLRSLTLAIGTERTAHRPGLAESGLTSQGWKRRRGGRGGRGSTEYEAERQAVAHARGEAVEQETRGFDVDAGRTFRLRSKEEARDYRYMPEPDVPELDVSDELVAHLQASLPELPADRRARYVRDYGLRADVARGLVDQAGAAAYFDATLAALPGHPDAAVAVANWCGSRKRSTTWRAGRGRRSGRMARSLNLLGPPRRQTRRCARAPTAIRIANELTANVDAATGTFRSGPVSPAQLASVVAAVRAGQLSGRFPAPARSGVAAAVLAHRCPTRRQVRVRACAPGLVLVTPPTGRMAKEAVEVMAAGDTRDAGAIARERGWQQNSDETQLAAVVDALVLQHPEQVRQRSRVVDVGTPVRPRGQLSGAFAFLTSNDRAVCLVPCGPCRAFCPGRRGPRRARPCARLVRRPGHEVNARPRQSCCRHAAPQGSHSSAAHLVHNPRLSTRVGARQPCTCMHMASARTSVQCPLN